MSGELISAVTREEVKAYLAIEGFLANSLFRSNFFDLSGDTYTNHTVLNYLVSKYNEAIRESKTSISLVDARFTVSSYKKICILMIPFLRKVKGIELEESGYIPTVWNIVFHDPQTQNVNEWPRLSGASPVRGRLLQIKE